MTTPPPDRKECVLRALAAAEIADSCPKPGLRESFYSLAGHWLKLAERHEAELQAEPRLQ